jgi:hypothetical protein
LGKLLLLLQSGKLLQRGLRRERLLLGAQQVGSCEAQGGCNACS